MRHFENIIVGFGKAGKTLAASLANHGQEVLVIEKDSHMYGGTCINVACLPTKNLIINAQKGIEYSQALEIKNQMTAKLRNKNYHKVADLKTATVLTADAEFLDDQTIQVTDESGKEQLTADRIFINTGSTPIIPDIEGINTSNHVFASREMLDRQQLAKKLVVLGSGPIGLEFASMYAEFGSQVLVLSNGKQILAREEPEVAAMALDDLQADGIDFAFESQLTKVKDTEAGLQLTYQQAGQEHVVQADALLVATGRRPNIDDLHLERTTIELGDHSEILVDDQLKTNVDHIWALGDVNGGPQFTYISLDDFRIVNNQLLGDHSRTLANRTVYPHTTFLNPAISSIGLTEAQAKTQGLNYQIVTMPTAGVPKANVIGNPRGMYKVVLDQDTKEILGMTIYAEEAYETINLISLAMQQHVPATVLGDQIYAHPTMTEALNDLFANL
ncbi:FAD-dependent oxidoreductase [Paucilactobacillus kaifaensis]|uniref:FAD-dependent oxidoreductase n=1 Tax=Paucilactobacillus kaifaensis TaxID=2559921 RepID=UPI0010F60685|nr:FAD-dependent oxidoreductase [Paucilactobacillus kaifaensis]